LPDMNRKWVHNEQGVHPCDCGHEVKHCHLCSYGLSFEEILKRFTKSAIQGVYLPLHHPEKSPQRGSQAVGF